MDNPNFEQWIEGEDELVFNGTQLLNDLLVQKGRLEIELAASQNQCQLLECQHNLLVSTCKLAMEWAAGYPLGSGIDKLAAGEVYNACECALLMKGDTPNA